MLKHCYTFLLPAIVFASCVKESDNVQNNQAKIDSLTDSVSSHQMSNTNGVVVNAYDSVAGFNSCIHHICIDDYIYTACATVMIRPPEEKNVAVFAKKCFRQWLTDQVGNGLLIYLGTDSLGCLWTIEAEQEDASEYYFAHLCCRNENHGLMWRSLLDSHLDCDYEAFDAAIAYPFNKRVDVYTGEFALNRLSIDSGSTEVATAGTMANAEGAGYEELKLTVNTTDGKVHRWFFIESADMCWSAYEWEVR